MVWKKQKNCQRIEWKIQEKGFPLWRVQDFRTLYNPMQEEACGYHYWTARVLTKCYYLRIILSASKDNRTANICCRHLLCCFDLWCRLKSCLNYKFIRTCRRIMIF
jgi:hypothetical protein